MRLPASLIAVGLLAVAAAPVDAAPAEGVELREPEWSHEGPFGTYDRASLQRGLQVYQNVCQSCHGLELVAFRTLTDLGYSEEQVKAVAEQYEVDGQPAEASDYVPSPYPDEASAREANGGALPPDLSLITKARMGGPDYLYSLLTGYHDEPPPGVELMEGMYYNEYFSGHQIAMPPPLAPDLVTFEDGSPASVEQMAKDVTHFLTWTAEPKLEERKQMGLKAGIFLVVLTGLLYAYKRKIWSDVEH